MQVISTSSGHQPLVFTAERGQLCICAHEHLCMHDTRAANKCASPMWPAQTAVSAVGKERAAFSRHLCLTRERLKLISSTLLELNFTPPPPRPCLAASRLISCRQWPLWYVTFAGAHLHIGGIYFACVLAESQGPRTITLLPPEKTT